MLFFAGAFRQQLNKSRHVLPCILPSNYTCTNLLHASAPVAKRGPSSISLPVPSGDAERALGAMLRKVRACGLIDDIRSRRWYEKGAEQRVREQKESVMRRVGRDFRYQLQWCLKQRMRCVDGAIQCLFHACVLHRYK